MHGLSFIGAQKSRRTGIGVISRASVDTAFEEEYQCEI